MHFPASLTLFPTGYPFPLFPVVVDDYLHPICPASPVERCMGTGMAETAQGNKV
jgi:hypothetical protein